MQALYNSTTGRLISLADVMPSPLPAGMASKDLGAVDLKSVLWDEATRAMAAKPANVPVDRVDEWVAAILADSSFASAYGSLTTARKNNIQTGLRTVLASMLGRERFRGSGEGAIIA